MVYGCTAAIWGLCTGYMGLNRVNENQKLSYDLGIRVRGYYPNQHGSPNMAH